MRARFGLDETAGGALVGLATATPEISINVTSVALGWPDIGLGTALGSNLPALPLTLSIAYLSMRWHRRQMAARGEPPPQPLGTDGAPALEVKRRSIPIHALPYFGVIALIAALTLPPAWAGLQPIDGALLIAAFAIYFGQAVLRRRGKADAGLSLRRPVRLAIAGVAAIAGGAILSVLATDHLNRMLGIPALVGGLFITGLLCALPESIAAWPLGRSGRATAAASATIADVTISLTLAFVPLALAGTAVGDQGLLVLNLATLAALVALYVVLNRTGAPGHNTGREVLLYDAVYLAYLAVTAALLAKQIGSG
jgi:cation:H+ antiporter